MHDALYMHNLVCCHWHVAYPPAALRKPRAWPPHLRPDYRHRLCFGRVPVHVRMHAPCVTLRRHLPNVIPRIRSAVVTHCIHHGCHHHHHQKQPWRRRRRRQPVPGPPLPRPSPPRMSAVCRRMRCDMCSSSAHDIAIAVLSSNTPLHIIL